MKKLIKYCKDNFSLYEGCVNPGDLILFDTSGVHYASQLTRTTTCSFQILLKINVR